MTRRIIRINPLTSKHWTEFVAVHPNSTIFHHPLWLWLLHQQYGYLPLAYCLVNGEGIVRAGIPFLLLQRIPVGRCLTSLPFTDYCNPLYEDEDALRDLLKHLVYIRDEDRFDRIEIRSTIPEVDGFIRSDDSVIHTLQLRSDPDIVFQEFKKTQVQQCIHKAEREGVTIRFDRSKAGVNLFYKLQTITRRRLGVPVQPKHFFDLLWSLLIRNGMGFVVLAFAQDILVSASVLLNYKTVVYHKYSASDSHYWNLRPNNLVIWKAIEWACLNGYRIFDFGKSRVTNTGLRRFKDGWGTIERQLPYSFISNGNIGTGNGSSTLEAVAEKVIQKSPVFVCRTIGELLYKYFG